MLASVCFSQKIEVSEIQEANKYLLHNLECSEILIKQDRIIDACDSVEAVLKVKLNQSESLVNIHKSVEVGQAKELEKEKAKAVKMVKKRNRWRRFGIFAIIENLGIGTIIYLNLKQ